MAVTITGVRKHQTKSTTEFRTFIQYALSGTYLTGGFVTPYSTVAGSLGTSPNQSKTPIAFTWFSPKGYIYVSTTAGAGSAPVITTQIFSAPNTELANTTAVPDAAILCAVDATTY